MKILNIICIAAFIMISYALESIATTVKIPVMDEKLSFAIIADPQVSARTLQGKIHTDAWQTLEQACADINLLKPDFTVFLGDLVNVFEPHSVDNFRQSISGLKGQIYLVHGNHDTRYPYAGFIELNRNYCKAETVNYSFDCKGWHFIALPCDFNLREEVYEWLRDDLQKNSNKPTVIFEHFHLLPLGLSQLEYYSFLRNDRKRLMDIFEKNPQIHYYFNGHVHNGAKSAVKMTKSYKGITFVTVPTVIESRACGEEYDQFIEGTKRGGYYMVVDIDGEKVDLNIRLSGTNAQCRIEKPEIIDNQIEPTWFNKLSEIAGADRWTNSGFEQGLEGWNVRYRYMTDTMPGFAAEVVKGAGEDNRLRIGAWSRHKSTWANDEYHEVYKIVHLRKQGNLILKADYTSLECINGGGFIRAIVFDKKGNSLIYIFRWGENERNADFFSRCLNSELKETIGRWNYITQEALEKRAFLVSIDAPRGEQRHLAADLSAIYDKALETRNGLAKFVPVKIFVGIGVRVNKGQGAVEALFDNVEFRQMNKGKASRLVFTPIDYGRIFESEFGFTTEERVSRSNRK